jgi:rhodanese-related sulfurtransferase
MKKILLILLLALNAQAEFSTLSVKQVQEKIKQGVAVIDVRRKDEYQRYGIIPNSHKLTFFDSRGRYNAQKWLSDLSKIVKDKDTPFILVCAYANRTKTIGNFLNKNTEYQNIFELKNGINGGWLDEGLASTKIPAKNKSNSWFW